MILITFALPHESGGFLSKLQNRRLIQEGALPILKGVLTGRDIVVLHTGVGREQAKNRCAAFLSRNPPQLLISAGYAGGLDERLQTGSLFFASNFSDPTLLAAAEGFAGGAAFTGNLTTQDQVAETPEAKRELARITGSLAVDMETAAIYGECRSSDLPMISVRAISDPVGTAMPVPGRIWFNQATQKPRVLALLAYLGGHPSRIPAFARFVRGAGLARNQLSNFLSIFLAQIPLLPQRSLP